MNAWSELLSIDAALTAWINSFAGNIAALDLGVSSLSAVGPYLMVGLIVLRWWAKAARTVQRRDKWSPLFVVLAFLVSLSRVYIGTHFVSDVAGGAVIGAGAAGVVAYLYRESYGLLQRVVRIA